jgi:hypothetical protein
VLCDIDTHQNSIWYTELGFRQGLPPLACSLGRPPRVLQLRRRRPRVLPASAAQQPRPLAARRPAPLLPLPAARVAAVESTRQRAARPGLSARNAGLPARPRPELLVLASRGHARGCLRGCPRRRGGNARLERPLVTSSRPHRLHASPLRRAAADLRR